MEAYHDFVMPASVPGKLANLIDVIQFCQARNLPADVVGRWVWVRFDSKPDESTREALKSVGFRWVSRRGEWAHNCGHPCHHGDGEPRFKYGAVSVDNIDAGELCGAVA